MESKAQRMTQDSVTRLVLSLALPSMVSMVVSALYNTADIFFVAKLGTSAAGAVGVVFSIIAMIQAVGITLGMGAGSFVTLSVENEDNERACEYASSAFFLAVLSGVFITAAGLQHIDGLMRLLGSTETILPYARSYGLYILLCAPIMCALTTMSNILRLQGMAVFVMRALVIGGITNIILVPIFIFALGFGAAGAGIGTLISQLVSFSIQLSFFIPKDSPVRIVFSKVSLNPKIYIDIVKFGIPSLLRNGLVCAAAIVLNISSAAYGDAAVAAMSIVARILIFLMSVLRGISQGFLPVIVYNYGKNLYSRVIEAFWFAVRFGIYLMSVLASASFIFAPEIILLFSTDPAVHSIAVPAMRFQCVTLFLQPFFIYSSLLLQTAGNTGAASFLACTRQGIYFIPLIAILPAVFGVKGIQSAQPISDTLSFFTTIPFLFIFIKKLRKAL